MIFCFEELVWHESLTPHTVLWWLYIEDQKHILNFWIYDAFYLKMVFSRFMRFFKLVDHKILNFATKIAKLLELVSVLTSPDWVRLASPGKLNWVVWFNYSAQWTFVSCTEHKIQNFVVDELEKSHEPGKYHLYSEKQ